MRKLRDISLFLVLGFVLRFFLGCQKKEDFSAVQLIGHAGMGLEMKNAPFHDNSFEAIQFALEQEGSAGVEMDVQLSADGVLWLYHDANLSSETNQTGCIFQLTETTLSATKYAGLQQQKMAKLDQILALNQSKTLVLDLRHSSACTNAFVPAKQFDSLLQKAYSLHPNLNILIVSNNWEWASKLELSKHHFYLELGNFDEFSNVENQANIEGIVVRNSTISTEEVQKLQAKGKKVLIFDIRSPKGIRNALRKKPNFLMSDDLRASIIEKYK